MNGTYYLARRASLMAIVSFEIALLFLSTPAAADPAYSFVEETVSGSDFIGAVEIGPCTDVGFQNAVAPSGRGLEYSQRCDWRIVETWRVAETLPAGAFDRPIWARGLWACGVPPALDPGRHVVFVRLHPEGWFSVNHERGFLRVEDGLVPAWPGIRRANRWPDRTPPTVETVRAEAFAPPERLTYGQTIEYLDQDLARNPDDTQALVDRGRRRMGTDDDGALADLDRALALDPGLAAAYAHRGEIRLKRDEIDRAARDLDEAIRLNSDDRSSYANRALVHLVARRFDSAARDAEEALVPYRWGFRAYSFPPLVVGYFALRLAGRETEAAAFLRCEAADSITAGWPGAALRYLRGEIGENDLLAAANDRTMPSVRTILAADLLLRGERERAEAHLRWLESAGPPGVPAARYAEAVLQAVQNLSR